MDHINTGKILNMDILILGNSYLQNSFLLINNILFLYFYYYVFIIYNYNINDII